MSVEQTTQLIQLILNSVLMSVACALVLGALTLRHSTISDRLETLSRQDDRVQTDRDRAPSHPMLARKQFRRLQQRHIISRYSVLTAYYALLFSALSCFALAVRGILDWNWLISFALGIFVFGIAALLVAVVLTLLEIHLSDFAKQIPHGNRPSIDDSSNLWHWGKQSRLRASSRRPIKKSLGALGHRVKVG
jgi:Flp pilus assembly protein TadB